MLIADDQVPDSSLSSEKEIIDHYTKLYDDERFAKGFSFIRELINLLKSRGYIVDFANTPDEVINLVKKTYIT